MTSDVETVQSNVARVSHHIDAKRWDELRALFAKEVAVDYTSLFGGTAQRQRADELVSGWKAQLAAVTTHHLLGPIDVIVTEGVAKAECHVRANHYAHGERWVVEGHYVFELAKRDGWAITAMTFQSYHERGTRKVLTPG